jgi:hypothetical protein
MKRGALVTLMALVAVLVGAWPALSQAIRVSGQAFTGTLGSTLTFSGVTTDITTVGNEDLVIVPDVSGTGSVQIGDGDGIIDLLGTSGSVIGQLSMTSASGPELRLGTGSNDGLVRAQDASNGGVLLGNMSNISASTRVANIADNTAALVSFYGEGQIAQDTPTVCDCGTAGTPNTVTCDPQSTVVVLQDGDADACTVTWSTTTADSIDKYLPRIVVVVGSVGGGGAFNLADQAGILELTGAFAMGANDSLQLHYNAGSIDAYEETGRAAP